MSKSAAKLEQINQLKPSEVAREEKALIDAKLEQINRIKQKIHNLRMRVPIGIRSVDEEHTAKRKRLEALLKDLEAQLEKIRPKREARRSL